MEYEVKRRRRHRNRGTGLMILTALLVAVLIVTAVIALSISQDEAPPAESTGGTSVPPPEDTSPSEPAAIAGLTVTAPDRSSFLSVEKQVEFCGTVDPRGTLTIGAESVTVAEDGSFRHTVQLENGINEIPVTYRGETVTYHIEHRYVLQYFTPTTGGEYGCGATVQINAAIRKGAELSVTLNGELVEMEESADQLGANLADGFVLYTGTYQLPSRNLQDMDLGPITFSASYDGVTETGSTGNIICLKRTDVLSSDPSVTPNGGSYVDVGSGYIVEILTNSAETFLGSDVSKDKSNPTVNYLPKGTVDYGYVEDIENGTYTIRLRCGRRVYATIKNYPPVTRIKVVDTYLGTLPDHNEISIASVKQTNDYTTLTFDVLWKAPFYFDLLPQQYANASIQDFQVTALTAEYVDITFCYATVFNGTVSIPSDNPLFSRAVLTQNDSDCTLRLYLKEKGRFFGWDASYNSDGQLCFRFINPKTVAKTTANVYGVDLTGVRIMLDVGHGGADGGTQPDGAPVDEAALNLQLALKLKAELESMGATVLMNRTDDSSITVQERIAYLKEQAPDLCIAVHQNSLDGYPNFNGFEIGYATPFSQRAAQLIYEETIASGIYDDHTMYWHYYYVARETACPVVLLENGYMTNAKDLANMLDEAVQVQKAQAIARGIARYFLAISK